MKRHQRTANEIRELNDAELDGVRTRLRQSREQELQLLTSPEAKELLARRGIQLISYHEL